MMQLLSRRSKVKTSAPGRVGETLQVTNTLRRVNTENSPEMGHVVLFGACLLVAFGLSHVAAMKSHERLLLSSLGLSERPWPAGSDQPRRRVPSVLWRMFRKADNIQTRENDPCTVSEYGVRGNIIRYVQDQGTEHLTGV